jgi:hypothetical protein
VDAEVGQALRRKVRAKDIIPRRAPGLRVEIELIAPV